MDTSGEASSCYFYFHLLVIHELGVLVPFTSFEMDFLTIANVSPSQITLNVYSDLRDFQIMFCKLHVPPTIWVFLSLFSIEILPNNGQEPLRFLSGRFLLNPYASPYEDLKDRFVQVKGRNDTSLVTTRATCPLFPLSWTPDLHIIKWVA